MLRVRVGQLWRTRDRSIVEITHYLDGDAKPIVGRIDRRVLRYDADGFLFGKHGHHDLDLIGLHKERR